MKIITKEGQIKAGDKLKIDDQYVTAREIISVNGNEKVIINKKLNHYFITKLLINGKSWAKQVFIVESA
jgi:hypothetical protein